MKYAARDITFSVGTSISATETKVDRTKTETEQANASDSMIYKIRADIKVSGGLEYEESDGPYYKASRFVVGLGLSFWRVEPFATFGLAGVTWPARSVPASKRRTRCLA